jgi:signal transduction histidine kinase
MRVRAAISKVIGTPLRRMVALLALVNLFVVCLVWIALDTAYHQSRDKAATTSLNTNRLVSQSIAADIDRLDLALRAVADDIGRHSAGGATIRAGEMDEILTGLHRHLPMADSLRATNPQGYVITGSNGVPTGISAADRDYFIALRDDPALGLAISKPMVGRISGKWVLIFARRISLADGRFGGVVYAPVTIEWFEAKFADLNVGPNGAVVLRGDSSRNFDLLARVPHAGFVGQTTVSERFRDSIAAHPEGGTYEARAGADNVSRIFSYQSIDGVPLVALVGIATQDYLGDWWDTAVKSLALMLAFAAATSFGAIRTLRTWRELEQRTEQLARSNSDLEQFAYVASHDLQTPLRTIASYAQLLARRYRGRLDTDADEFIAFIVDGAQHMTRMISDLLDYARLSTAEPSATPVDLDRIVAAVLARFADHITTTGAGVTLGPLPVVQAEIRPMESLFQNLIENALTYRDPHRPPRIDISARPAGTGMWSISVRDNGIGIDPAYQDKIFIIFQRLAPTRFPDGTGIGLALCRRIAQRFGGSIVVDSTPGVGTTMTVTLPQGEVTPTGAEDPKSRSILPG